ncbi:hypothetical protein [Trinickia dinghuensis]|uniref:hypothetical protein n=1 Tax=Trinickia dinghuensis TaxID=2291023 RepID=UPI0015F15A7A|nr:hypothetical protein [Trinickia dinghuensis]
MLAITSTWFLLVFSVLLSVRRLFRTVALRRSEHRFPRADVIESIFCAAYALCILAVAAALYQAETVILGHHPIRPRDSPRTNADRRLFNGPRGKKYVTGRLTVIHGFVGTALRVSEIEIVRKSKGMASASGNPQRHSV